MENHNMKVRRGAFLFLLCLLCSVAAAKQMVPDCCRQKSCSCRIFELLHGMGNHATGILTLGKRGSATAAQAFHSQLYRLFHGSGKQAAGILTMGKRAGREVAGGHLPNGTAHLTPTLYAPRPNPAGSCLGPLEKDWPPGPKTSAADATY